MDTKYIGTVPYRDTTDNIAGSLPNCSLPLGGGAAALAAPPPKGSGGTSVTEALNCSLRQRCGVLVRRSCSFSKSLTMHNARTKIVIDDCKSTLSYTIVNHLIQ